MPTATNPFDVSTTPATVTAPTAGVGQMQNAINSTAAPTTTGYNAVNAGATGFKAGTAASTGYTPDTANLTNWNVGKEQTVQGQLSGILAANSPLLQQAKANSLAQMNQRGLTNSSMAVGAGQQAVIASALPIAQQDASTFGQAGQTNAAAANQNAQFNVGQTNTAAQFGAGAQNTASLANTQEANRAAEFGASATNQAALTNAAATNQASQFTATAANQASQQYSQALNASVTKQLDQSMQAALASADAATKVQLQTIDAQTRASLADTEARYKNQMQVSASASEIFNQTTKNIADIMANPDISANPEDGVNGVSPKQAAVNQQKAALQNAMQILSQTTGITGLKDLITFT
jgi:hypothetical protein